MLGSVLGSTLSRRWRMLATVAVSAAILIALTASSVASASVALESDSRSALGERAPEGASPQGLPSEPPNPSEIEAADTSSGPHYDFLGDNGPAADLDTNAFILLDGNPGIASDDLIEFLSRFDTDPGTPGSQANLDGDDQLSLQLDLDNNYNTGNVAGAEFALFIFGDAGGPEEVSTNRWDGDSWEFVELLGYRELGGDLVDLVVSRQDLEVPRGVTIGVIVASFHEPTEILDWAPDLIYVPYQFSIDPTPTPPGVAPAAAPAPGLNSATFSAQVNPQGLATTYRFQYGATTSYGSETGTGDAGAGRAATAVSQSVQSLATGTTYNYRVVATNAAGTTFGPNQTVTTAFPAPVAATGRAVPTGPRSLRLTGTADTGGFGGTAYFEYGPSQRFGSRTPGVSVNGTSGKPARVQVDLRKLRSNTQYFYRLVVETPGGRSLGRNLSARTGIFNKADLNLGAALQGTGIVRLRASVRIIKASSGKVLSARGTLRRLTIRIFCARLCKFNRTVRFNRPTATVSTIKGRTVRLGIARGRREASVDLLPLVAGYSFPPDSELQVWATGPRLLGSASRLTITKVPKIDDCELQGGQVTDCRR